MNKKGCIFLISARKNLIKDCLKYLDENYNKKFNYPILIFYHKIFMIVKVLEIPLDQLI